GVGLDGHLMSRVKGTSTRAWVISTRAWSRPRWRIKALHIEAGADLGAPICPRIVPVSASIQPSSPRRGEVRARAAGRGRYQSIAGRGYAAPSAELPPALGYENTRSGPVPQMREVRREPRETAR